MPFSLSDSNHHRSELISNRLLICYEVPSFSKKILVDGVSDVISLGSEHVKPAPALGSVIETEFIMGLGTVDERMLILIDIEKMMRSSDMGLIEQGIN